MREFGSEGNGNGQFKNAFGLAFAHGGLYVVDNGNKRVEEFTSEGTYLTQFSTGPSAGTLFSGPYGIATNPANGDLYIADRGNDRVDVFTPTGTLINSFGSEGEGSGQFAGPLGVAISAAGEVYVTDGGNDRVEKWVP